MWQQVPCSTGPLSKMSLGGCTINRTWDQSTWSHQHDIELKRLGLQLPPQLATGVSMGMCAACPVTYPVECLDACLQVHDIEDLATTKA